MSNADIATAKMKTVAEILTSTAEVHDRRSRDPSWGDYHAKIAVTLRERAAEAADPMTTLERLTQLGWYAWSASGGTGPARHPSEWVDASMALRTA